MKHTKGPYYDGFITGFKAYAWWKDGIEYVGSYDTTLKEAIEKAEVSPFFFKDANRISLELPHSCDDPDCPGAVNKRKLEMFEEMVAALQEAEGHLAEELADARFTAVHPGGHCPVLDRVRTVLAKAKGE